MTQGPNRVLDEFAKLMTDAAGVADGFRREAESAMGEVAKWIGERSKRHKGEEGRDKSANE